MRQWEFGVLRALAHPSALHSSPVFLPMNRFRDKRAQHYPKTPEKLIRMNTQRTPARASVQVAALANDRRGSPAGLVSGTPAASHEMQ